MDTIKSFSESCGMTTDETVEIFREAGVQVDDVNNQLSRSDFSKVTALAAKIAINKAIMQECKNCESIILTKCPTIWKGCADTRAEFDGDYGIFEAYHLGVARGVINMRQGGLKNVH